jgi:clan AA aspartic protease (TIGR02281 family)
MNNKSFVGLAILFLLILGYNSSALAAVYRWKNGKGQTHYSSVPPTTSVKNVEVKIDNKWYPYSADQTPVPTPQRNSRAVVSYKQQNSIIIIPITINGTLDRLFAVDTGASYTIIAQNIANTLNLMPNPEIPPITLQTANGLIQAPLVNLETVTVGHLTTHNITAAIHDFQESSEIGGLLGLNFLNRFKMTVDSTRHQLTLEPIQALSTYLAHDCVAAREWLIQGQALKDASEQEVSYYQKAIALCPDLVEAYYHLGTVYYQQKEYQRAIDVHHQILRLQSDDPEAHYRLGVLYMLERQFVLAKGEFQKTLELAPAHKRAGEHLEQLKNY